MLPAHAVLTDGSGSSADDEPAPLNYFQTDIEFSSIQGEVIGQDKSHLLASIADALIPEALASDVRLGGISVVIANNSATIRFLNSNRVIIFRMVAPLDGTNSTPATIDAIGVDCKKPQFGPKIAKLIGYTLGDQNVRVTVDGGESNFTVVVPMAPIGTLSVVSCEESDIRLKTNIEALSTSRKEFNLYKFQYLSDADKETYVGVMAQDVMSEYPEAIDRNDTGFFMVRYDLLGLKMVTLDDWESNGPDSVELKH